MTVRQITPPIVVGEQLTHYSQLGFNLTGGGTDRPWWNRQGQDYIIITLIGQVDWW